MDFVRPDARYSCVTNDLLTHVRLLEADISLLADVIAIVLDVAVCERDGGADLREPDDEARALAEREVAIWRRKCPRGPTQTGNLTSVAHPSQRQRSHALHPDLPSNGSARRTHFRKTRGDQHNDHE